MFYLKYLKIRKTYQKTLKWKALLVEKIILQINVKKKCKVNDLFLL